jgi:hypothetical protein
MTTIKTLRAYDVACAAAPLALATMTITAATTPSSRSSTTRGDGRAVGYASAPWQPWSRSARPALAGQVGTDPAL